MSTTEPTIATTRTSPKVDLDATQERLTRLGLLHPADHLAEGPAEATKHEWAPHRFLDELLDRELGVREERRVKMSLKPSGLPMGQTLATFAFAFQPRVERSRIEKLGICVGIRARESLLIQGPPGVGRTPLVIALGLRAIENGFSVAFHSLEDLVAALKRDAHVRPIDCADAST